VHSGDDRDRGEVITAFAPYYNDSSSAELRAKNVTETRVMVATDIAARGIDIDEITHVINYDVPDNPESYIHRIGRTARAEMSGDAFTLVDKEEEPYVRAIEQALGKALPRVTLPSFDYKRPLGGGGFRRGPPHQRHRHDSRRGAGR